MKGRGQLQTGLGWWEIKMVGLLGFIFFMLALGNRYKMGEVAAKAKDRPAFWRWGAPLNERLGVTFKAPWLMTEADLTLGRVVYNWLTKPGFRWLVVEVGIASVVLGAMVKGAGWLWVKTKQGLTWLTQSTVRVQIAGTVMIVNNRGLIYAADELGEVVGEEAYGFCLATVRVSIVTG